jgi:hypothetical protein
VLYEQKYIFGFDLVVQVGTIMADSPFTNKSALAPGSNAGPGNLVSALIEELAHEVPEDAGLDAVKADLLAASRSYDGAKKKDLALRFYLATRSLLREHALLQERLRKVKNQAADLGRIENAPPAAQDRQSWRPPNS